MILFARKIIALFIFILLFVHVKAEQTDHNTEELNVDSAQWYYQQAYDQYDEDLITESTQSFEIAVNFELLKQVPDYYLICDALGNACYNYFLLNRYSDGIRVGYIALGYATKYAFDEQISTNHANLGCCYFSLDQYEKAVDHFSKALDIDIILGDEKGLSNSYNNLGKVYEAWGKFDFAKNFYLKALAKSLDLNDDLTLGVRYSNLAMVYHKIGESDSAIYLMGKAFLADMKIGNRNKVATRYSNLGLIYLENQQLEKADEFFNKALDIFLETQNERSLAITYNHLGKLAQINNQAHNAIGFINKSIDLCNLLGLKEIAMRNHMLLSELYEQANQPQKALDHFRKYTTLNDSVFNNKSLMQLQEMEVRYETEKQKSNILLLQQENELSALKLKKKKAQVIFYIAGIGILLFAALLLYHFLMLKNEAHIQQLAINKTKDRFFAIIAHDLKNPVNAFNTLALALKNKHHLMTSEQLNNNIEQLAISADKLNQFLRELLQWTISQKGETKLDVSSFNICELITGEIAKLETDLEAGSLTLECELGMNHTLSNDRNMVQTILRNLLANAVKFSPEGAKIGVKAECNSNGLTVSVTDQGPGIQANDLKSIFSIKGEAKGKVNSNAKGAGIGLIICKELVSLIGGSIWAENNVNIGTTFFFSIPNQSKL